VSYTPLESHAELGFPSTSAKMQNGLSETSEHTKPPKVWKSPIVPKRNRLPEVNYNKVALQAYEAHLRAKDAKSQGDPEYHVHEKEGSHDNDK